MIRMTGVSAQIGTFALENVSLEVPPGEVLAVLGPSGAGKSVLLHVLTGRVPVRSGEILLGDRDITHLPPESRGIALVPQAPALFPHLSVVDNICLGRRNIERGRLRQLAALLQIEPLLERRSIHGLSGGEAQRVTLARAILADPQALALDECFAHVDIPLRKQLQMVFRTLQRDLHFTTVLVTHDREEAFLLGHRVAVLMDGRVVQSSTPTELWAAPADVRVAEFLGIGNRFQISRFGHTDGRVLCMIESLALVLPPGFEPRKDAEWLVFAEEDVLLHGPPEATGPPAVPPDNAFLATVQDVAVVGNFADVQLVPADAPSLTVRARVPRSGFPVSNLQPGTRLRVSIPPTALRLVPGM